MCDKCIVGGAHSRRSLPFLPEFETLILNRDISCVTGPIKLWLTLIDQLESHLSFGILVGVVLLRISKEFALQKFVYNDAYPFFFRLFIGFSVRAFSATPPLATSTGNCSEAVVHKVAKCNWWR